MSFKWLLFCELLQAVLDLCCGSGASSQCRLFAPLLVSKDHHTVSHRAQFRVKAHDSPWRTASCILLNPYARFKLSDALSLQHWKCSSKKFRVTTALLKGCETKCFLEVSNKCQKHELSFLISAEETSSYKIVSRQGFPLCKSVILRLVRYVFPASKSAQIHTGSMNFVLCKNSGDPY